jgi:hypothetical protein
MVSGCFLGAAAARIRLPLGAAAAALPGLRAPSAAGRHDGAARPPPPPASPFFHFFIFYLSFFLFFYVKIFLVNFFNLFRKFFSLEGSSLQIFSLKKFSSLYFFP